MNTSVLSERNYHTILARLKRAVKPQGDFPLSIRALQELRVLVPQNNYDVAELVKPQVRDPLLAIRILHIANLDIRDQALEIDSISDALERRGHFIVDQMSKSFVRIRQSGERPAQNTHFAQAVTRSFLTTILAGVIAQHTDNDNIEEHAHLAGSFWGLGPLLLAYYYPHLFTAAEKRARRHGCTITQSIAQTLGFSPHELSIGILDSLSIPESYGAVLSAALNVDDSMAWENLNSKELSLASHLEIATMITEALVSKDPLLRLETSLELIHRSKRLSCEQTAAILAELPAYLGDFYGRIDIPYYRIPRYVIKRVTEKDSECVPVVAQDPSTEFSRFQESLVAALYAGESMASVLALSMEALQIGLKYKRVILTFKSNASSKIDIQMSLGEFPDTETWTHTVKTSMGSTNGNPIHSAYETGTLCTEGTSVITETDNFAALPIRKEGLTVGALYAEDPSTDVDNETLHYLIDVLEEAA